MLMAAAACLPGWRGRRALAERRAVAAMEFALILPLLILLLSGAYDIARALLLWQELDNAAEAIVQAAEKLSLPPLGSASTATALDPTGMQTAMTAIYAEVPGLTGQVGGDGLGSFPGPFAVTLSEVVFLPLCGRKSRSNPFDCTPETPLDQLCASNSFGTKGDLCTNGLQTAYTLWSAYLFEGGSQLMLGAALLRPCNKMLSPVSRFPNDNTQYSVMIDPNSVLKAVPMIVSPQVVADVQYTFTPSLVGLLAAAPPPWNFSFGSFTLWASATLPTPQGGTDQAITLPSQYLPSASNPNPTALPAWVSSCYSDLPT